MQVERAVRLAAMQVNRDCRNRDVRQQQGGDDQLPPTKLQQSTVEKFQETHGNAFLTLGGRPEGGPLDEKGRL